MKRNLKLIKIVAVTILSTVMVVGTVVAPNVYADVPQPAIIFLTFT